MTDPLMQFPYHRGYKIVVVKPHKNYIARWGWYRSRKKLRTQRYLVHVGWTELILTGNVIKNDTDMTMFMNAETYQALCNAIDADRREQSGVPYYAR